MNAEQYARIKVLFAHARELEVDERGEYLDQATGGDKELRTEVEELLEADIEHSGGAFDRALSDDDGAPYCPSTGSVSLNAADRAAFGSPMVTHRRCHLEGPQPHPCSRMNPIARNIMAIVVGLFVGGFVNLGLVSAGPSMIPLPEGADITTMDGLRESMKLFEPANFLFPWLGHALGTLVGAFVAAKIAATHPVRCAIAIGAVFLLGGITMVVQCGGPKWFIWADLALAYIPMALIGGSSATRK